jgi:flavin reductase (DIM6/NTAB) family NADH-FMN oxidoreductase RutF
VEQLGGGSGGDMTVSSDAFVSAMRNFPAAVNVITTGSGDGRAGLTATAVFSLTAEPPQIAISINHNASAYRTLVDCGFFGVSTLASHQEAIARRFAGGAKGLARFEQGEWFTDATGASLLAGAMVNLDCRIERSIDFSTHTLFVGRVEALRTESAAKPLLFVDGNWASLLPATARDVSSAAGFMQQSIGIVDHVASNSGDPGDALDRFVREFTKLNIDGRRTTSEHLGAELYASTADLEPLNELKREFDERLLALIQKGVQQHAFDIEDPRIAAFAIVGMIVWTFKWYRPGGRLSIDELGAKLAAYARRMVEDRNGNNHR